MSIGKKIRSSVCCIKDNYIIQQCSNKKVLHVGCTDYPFFEESLKNQSLLHTKLVTIAQDVIGIDIAIEDVLKMQQLGYDVRVIDAHDMSSHNFPEKFDVIVLGDVIEHLTNPGMVLTEAKKLLAPDGKIIISVPNAFGIVRFLKSFFGYEQVHQDHVAYYSSGTLETFAQNLELEILDMAWYRFEVRDRRFIVYFAALIERLFTIFFPWQAEGCITTLTIN